MSLIFWFPENIQYERTIGAVEVVCPGCRQNVVSDVHMKSNDKGNVGRCRLCGFFGQLPDDLQPTSIDQCTFLASKPSPPQVEPFIEIHASAYDMSKNGSALELSKERALLASIALALKWHRPRVFRSRTLFAIIAAFILGFVLFAIAVAFDNVWLGYLIAASLTAGVLWFHQKQIRLRASSDMKSRISRFTTLFNVSLDELIQIGLRDGGDLKDAAQFLRRTR